jgi:hypothetical protein
MAITSVKTGSSFTNLTKYNDFVAGYPSLMAAPTATDGGTGSTASVAFTAQAGATSYGVISTPGSFTGTGSSSPVTVSGLTAGTAYTFQVRAVNSIGTGPYSAASNSVTPITPSSYESIASTTATGGSTVTFSSIPGTYQHLQVRMLVKTTTDAVDFRMTANGVTSGYASHFLVGSGTTASATAYSGASNIRLDSGSGLNVNSYGYSYIIIDLQDYANTTRNKTFRMFYGADYNTSGGEVYLGSGLTTSTSAITSLSFNAVSATFANPSYFALYGIKG